MKALIAGLTIAGLLAGTSTAFAAAGGKGKKNERDPAQLFKKLDANGDGQLTFEEFKGQREEERARKTFARMDADKNGVLKVDEFKLPERKRKNT